MATVIDVDSLGLGGFIIEGEADGDLAGFSVSSAGDINGDGFDDIILSARNYDNSSQAYVIFGNGEAFSAIALADLESSQGFGIGASYGVLETAVSSAGDVNGDGFDDLIVGVTATGGWYYYGTFSQAYVIFGGADDFGTIDLANMDDSTGFALFGGYSYGFASVSVSSAGDVNGDGFADIIIGSGTVDDGGEAYVVFGKADGFEDIGLHALGPADGFVIVGENTFDGAGTSVSGAGDVNGDGFDDIIVGAPGADAGGGEAGAAYVIFGKAGAFGTIDLGELGASAGFKIVGDAAQDVAGWSVSTIGDVNGDGFADLIIGAYGGDDGGEDAGEAYVIFGKASGFGTIDLTTLSSSAGFVIRGDAAGDNAGFSVSNAGDVNGDGFDDIIIGAPYGDDGGANAGEAYVIFGKADGFGTIDLTALAPEQGFIIQGSAPEDQTGYSVSAAGDINNDGFADVIVGAPFWEGDDIGRAYVIYGVAPTSSVTRVGTDIGQTIRGGSANDSLDGRGGDDRLFGGAGNDVIDGGTGGDTMAGNTGSDIYYVNSSRDVVVELGGQGLDTVRSTLSYTLGANVEQLRLLSTADINATGNSLANLLIGNSGNNILDGGLNGDTMKGREGNDIYYVNSSRDVVVEASGEGLDTVRSEVSYKLGDNVEQLRLLGTADIKATGNELDNLLVGNSGDNLITGGAGSDETRGGGGADTFAFNDGHFGGATVGTADAILDFSQAEGDLIDLSRVDANSNVDGEQTFTFIGTDAFSHTAGELRYLQANGDTYVLGDVDGDGTADFMTRLDGAYTLNSGDFLV